jgi:mycoredoxin
MSEPESPKIILYGHAACPQMPSTRAMLDQANAPYEYVNIREDDAARERVREINHGYESVPTLVFPDGSTLTEPSAGALLARLRAMGYRVPISALLVANALWIVIGIGVLIAILSVLGVV